MWMYHKGHKKLELHICELPSWDAGAQAQVLTLDRQVLWTTEPSLQPHSLSIYIFKDVFILRVWVL